ncbi:SRPBCC family protein [Planotetraspora sp. A-T 1434]|uniref:SRPBCC family protein n=1 Tax=Planotetraspora sp. A-T 1434 TaxID=2979219 RepID=UPI0021C0D553|nr:SRPBCC family protein [Planotetraspora sp. A-T 1434]MCT9931030.1 SRPBCC family protein [Planotetraspora sp. A-T 1434]
MSSIEHSVDVNVPIRTAYNQWTQFESFPEFMEGVESVKQIDDTRTDWVVEIAGVRREFEAEITEQHPDERVAWRSLDRPRQAGVVTFHRLSDDTTRVTLQMEYDPEGFAEKAADTLQIVRLRVRGDLERFKDFIESRGGETGAWRGEVPGPHQRGPGGSETGSGRGAGGGSGTGYDIGEPMPPQPVNPEYPRETPLPPPGTGPIPPAPGTGPVPPGAGPVPPRDTPGPVI